MPGSKGQKAVHACMIRLLNLGPAKHEEGVICVANQRIPNVCRIAGAACCGAIRGHQLGAKGLLTPTSCHLKWNTELSIEAVMHLSVCGCFYFFIVISIRLWYNRFYAR